jgi:hypothetical protein
MTRLLALAVAMLTTGSACAAEQADDGGADCTGSKCDKPDEGGAETCELRQADALDGAQKAYTREAIRWACSDVEGVNTNGNDDRGQEYCEYFAIVQPPPRAGGAEAEPELVGRGGDLSVVLDDDQIAALEDDPAATVGQCVFTSWHQDAPGPVPACTAESCPEVYGFRIEEENFRMLDTVNSNNAARLLVNDCLKPGPVGEQGVADDPLHSDYYRGCMMCGDLADQGLCVFWRRSDPTICAAVMRLAECGCGLDTDGDGQANDVNVAETLIPPQPTAEGVTLRGFPLGTWSGANELPAGCSYVETGDDSQTVVTCNLTASDLLGSATDPKGRCREKYGDNVVVHIPIDPDAIVCSAPPEGPYADTCDADPWVL